MIGDIGESMGTPNFCLYILLLNEKKVESRTIFTAFINSINVGTLSDLIPSLGHTFQCQIYEDVSEQENYVQ